MKLSKTAKTLVIFGLPSIAVTVVPTTVYFASSSSKNAYDRKYLLQDTQIQLNNRRVSFKEGQNSIRDKNNKPIKTTPVEQPKPTPKPQQPKEEIKVDQEKPKPITEEPPKEKPKQPEPPKEEKQDIKQPEEPEKPKEEIKQLEPPKEEPAKEIIIETPKQPEPLPPVVKDDEQPEVIETEDKNTVHEEVIEQDPPKEEPTQKEPEPTPKEETKPKPRPLKDNEFYIKFGDVNVRVTGKKELVPRVPNQNDVRNGITNRIEYLATLVSEITSVEVTDELKREVRKQALDTFRKDAPEHLLKDFKVGGPGAFQSLEDIRRHYDTPGGNNKRYFDRIIDKYHRLLKNIPRLKDFLSDEGKRVLEQELHNQLVDESKPDKPLIPERALRILPYIETSKITEIQPRTNELLAKGYVINDKDYNVYIDEEGRIGSYSATPLINTVITRLIHDNYTRRAFGYKSEFGRTPGDLLEGKYEGWKITNISKDPKWINYGIETDTDGIKVERLDKIEPDPSLKRNTGIRITIDASNRAGYTKTLELIKKLVAANEDITSYKIINIGSKDHNQAFYKIIKEIPQKLPQLELFFETENTSALFALEGKEIDELGLYTSGNSLKEEWSIPPLALKKVAYVATGDYNVSFDYPKGEKIPTRIVFNTIGFKDTDSIADINNGLRMVYFVRNNEPFFQGGYGAGLDPDHNEGGNSYPTGISFKYAPQIKTLQGLVFKDIYKESNGLRKLRRIEFFNNSQTYELTTTQLNEAQFVDILDTNPFADPKSEILFSNKRSTQNLRIVADSQNAKLSSKGIQNLNVLLEYVKQFGRDSTEIKVKRSNPELYNQIKGYSYKIVDDYESELAG
ncbi:putative immunoglobulin-blocking virulence protein [Mycoplasma procyoni]|uniref:putative immunoglobulin-blocking virulence protein n=1 Tax=Mycoplasma procyoni TaxID=568784 RepID=UPI00197BB05B|nr:putative immunoglobulin-blocking virulence protein [Mycoplasma procyoni]MBN3534645.1 putative immunoglobulin-blocking virulence protein [Mycoplasma procyoni]